MNKIQKIIFIDIDGVLQPFGSKARFDHDLDEFRRELATEHGNIYLAIDKYDVGAAALDWDDNAVSLLKDLLDAEAAELVVESSWREFHPQSHLLALFALNGLDSYITHILPKGGKQQVMEDFIAANPDIFSYVILDDHPFSPPLSSHQVVIKSGSLDDGDIEKAKLILSRGIG